MVSRGFCFFITQTPRQPTGAFPFDGIGLRAGRAAQQIIRARMIQIGQRRQMVHRNFALAGFIVAVNALVDSQLGRHLLLHQLMVLPKVLQTGIAHAITSLTG